MVNSRIDKYRDLRAGLKDEVGINRDNIEEVIAAVEVAEEDDFLTSVNRLFEEEKIKNLDDTLVEAKTFEQMRQEGSEEIDRALRSAKVSVGKEVQYNTRMDILNKIRESEKEVIRLNNLDNVETSQFSKGYFVNNEKENKVENDVPVVDKKKMTLLERLASMSPAEDAKKAKIILEDENNLEEDEEEPEKIATVSEQTDSLEDMIRQIKEKDQREVEKALKEKGTTIDIKMTKNEIEEQTNNDKQEEIGSREKVVEEKKKDRMVSVLNYIIIFLVIVFIGLCGMIGYQLFF